MGRNRPPRAGQRPLQQLPRPVPRPRQLPGPSTDAGSIFPERQFAHIALQATNDPKLMARKYDNMIRSFLSTIAAQSASENGLAQFLDMGSSPGPMSVLPKSGYIVLVLRPAPQWGIYQTDANGNYLMDSNGNRKLMKRPLKFLFRLRDFYLQGYFSSLRWKLFSDVKLKGLICGADINKFTSKLPYKSSYGRNGMNVDFKKVQIGHSSLQKVYRVLSDETGRYTQYQTQMALAAMAVNCCEATKRRSVCYRIVRLYRYGLSEGVDRPLPVSIAYTPPNLVKSEEEAKPSRKFNTWGNDCRKAWGGLEFEEGASEKEKVEQEKEYNRTLRDLAAISPDSKS